MAYDGTPPPDKGATLPTSEKTQEVLDHLAAIKREPIMGDAALDRDALLQALYEPALAAASAINLVRQGNAGMAPFIGAAGVVLSQALAPLVEHFGDQDLTFEQAFERIGIPVVRFSDLPNVPDVETPAADDDLLDQEDRESPGATTRPEEV
jgi:hypothetical protein